MKLTTIIDHLEHWVATQPDKLFSSFLDVHGNTIDTYTYREFHARTRHLAEYLSRHVRLSKGDRVLLVYPSGLEIIAAFVACARIGVIPVPVYPPTPVNFKAALAKLMLIARDCDARAALTTRELHRKYCAFSDAPDHADGLPELDWITTDDVRGRASESFHDDPGSILFLQYTSGSTGDPKGVIVSHENVIHNCRATTDHIPTAVCWLPQYHDMGLIGYYVYLVITGGTTYGFSPMNFLKRPLLWLQTLSRYRATYSSAPNFGFEYCLREDKIPADQLTGLDLSSVRVLMNGAEPVRAETFCRFLDRFGPYGLRPEAHIVAYGLAENTLAVTSYGRRIITVNKHLFQQDDVHIDHTSPEHNQLRLVSCGRVLDGIDLRIVDPETRTVLGSGQIGEIWLAGKSTTQGYWNRPDLTREVFHNTLAAEPDDQRHFLRTGDLGFLDENELFVCGRSKEIIIVRGVNYYPQDIERVVEATVQQDRAGNIAAFGGAGDDESLVIVIGVKSARKLPDPAEISRALRLHDYVGPHTIVFAPTSAISKTTSGKIARSLIRESWLNGELPTIATYTSAPPASSGPRQVPPGLRARFQHILAPFNLTGDEDHTLAEAGIDSLAMSLLLLEIERLLEERGITELGAEIDGRLLQRLTVAEFFALLNQFDTGSDEPTTALKSVLTQLKQENDAQEHEAMQQDIRLEPDTCTHRPASTRAIANVLLMGPTGFFGPFLLERLLRLTPYTYHVLVRARDQASGIERIRHALREAQLLGPALDAQLEQRVRVVCGDIAQHNLGLDAESWRSLTTQVQAVIHNAALVNYALNYDALRPHNVVGTRELLRFACAGNPKTFHFISSTIIFGWTPKAVLLETDNNDAMLNLDFGYAQTKWVGEQLILAAEDQGLEVRIYRPSFISASTRGVASNNDIVIRLLAFMINHGIAPDAQNQISFLPADIAAHNIATLFNQHHLPYRTYHVTVDDFYSLVDITSVITRDYGYQFTYFDTPSFIAEMKRRCVKEDLIYPLLDFFTRSSPKIAAMQHKRYDNRQYREVLEQSRTAADDPSLADTVSYLMAYLRREKLIPEPQVLTNAALKTT